MNYDDAKLDATFLKHLAVQRGSEMHDLARRCIKLGIKLPRTQDTFNQYVNDAIGFHMVPEQPLFYSINVFGTADSIAFRNQYLRIHDLKTGDSPVSIQQLAIYAALFCLEYAEDPREIGMELRIYQKGTVVAENPPAEAILHIMGKIVAFDKRIEKLKKEAQWEEEC